MNITLRPARSDDLEFSYKVTEDAMRGYVEQTWGIWDPAFQRKNHESSYHSGTHQVIVLEGIDAGILAVEDHASHVQLLKLYLLTGARNKGIGSRLLIQLRQSAASMEKPVRLQTLAVNHAAQRFYLRHGFAVTSTTPGRVFMEAA